MDKERIKKEAEQFVNPNSGYLHSEMKDGKAPMLVMSGSCISNLWQVCGIVNRISELRHMSFEATLGAIMGLHIYGYKKIMKELTGEEFDFMEGQDVLEDWKEEERKKITKEANANNMTLAFKIADLEQRNTSLNNQLVDVKKGYEKKIRAKNAEIDKLNKEILKLEHKIKEMMERNMFGDES
jgi:SMC interacting uncharacterized protein involved in chromosome segregation